MSKLIYSLLAGFWLTSASAQQLAPPTDTDATARTSASVPDSAQLEKELQGLKWEQFKSVVEAVPKLKADVDAYGPLGWQYVKSNYTTYGWKKSIDRLDSTQKQQLAMLIQKAKTAQ